MLKVVVLSGLNSQEVAYFDVGSPLKILPVGKTAKLVFADGVVVNTAHTAQALAEAVVSCRSNPLKITQVAE